MMQLNNKRKRFTMIGTNRKGHPSGYLTWEIELGRPTDVDPIPPPPSRTLPPPPFMGELTRLKGSWVELCCTGCRTPVLYYRVPLDSVITVSLADDVVYCPDCRAKITQEHSE